MALGAPKHVAIVMDGNRRWAKENKLLSEVGHWRGAESITPIVEAASNLGVEVLTLFSFSTENWLRTKTEVRALMKILEIYLNRKEKELIEKGVRLDSIGDLSKLPVPVQRAIERVKESTKEGKKISLVLALNYGGRDEICRAAKKLIDAKVCGKIEGNEITEELFAQYLDTAKLPDPDLLIRTSGEHRVSNFLLWQISYSELVISQKLWPEFGEGDLKLAIEEYQRRKRRYGE